jgi:hypothetical protein
MSDEPIRMDRSPEFRETLGVAKRLGPQVIKTARGIVTAIDAPGYSTLTLKSDDPDFDRVGILLYDPGEDVALGMIAQMTPTEARTIAASLFRLAALLDPRKPN